MNQLHQQAASLLGSTLLEPGVCLRGGDVVTFSWSCSDEEDQEGGIGGTPEALLEVMM